MTEVSKEMGSTSSGYPRMTKSRSSRCREDHSAEIDSPHAVVGLLQANVLVHERVRDVEQAVLKVERAGVGHALHQEVPGTPAPAAAIGIRPARGV